MRGAWTLLDGTRDRLLGSDPGLVRLRMASRTVLTLAVALGVLYLLTTATGQPLTVALLGVVIAMMSAMATGDTDPARQRITMGLLPLPAAAAVSLGALLASRHVAGDVVFVAIMFAATYARRFGSRGMALGMVAFMTYFFALFLGATVRQLPWLIAAVLLGAACSFVMRVVVFRDRPGRVLRATVRSLGARLRAVVAQAADLLHADHPDQRRRHLLRARLARLHETAAMVQGQLDGTVDVVALWPDVDDDQFGLRLLDIELAAERLVAVTERAAMSDTLPPAARARSVAALAALREALHAGVPAETLDRVARQVDQLHADHPVSATDEDASTADGGTMAYRLALAIAAVTEATRQMRALTDTNGEAPATHGQAQPETAEPAGPHPIGAGPPLARDRSRQDDSVPPAGQNHASRPSSLLNPITRQSIQVALAAALAIVAGELLSSARWYWAVISAFVIFSGTTSRGQTLSKGWQRALGTAAGVPAGVLIAAGVAGNTVISLILIFVCMFCGFYLMRVAYAFMAFWITTMLALLYGLLGEFSVGLLLLRIEETAIGAAIGVLVSVLVLPTSTRHTVREAVHDFLTALSDLLLATSAGPGTASAATEAIGRARVLDQRFHQLRTLAAPLTSGIAGVVGRGSAHRTVRLLAACDHYGRLLARVGTATDSPAGGIGRPAGGTEPATAVLTAVDHVRHNVDAVAGLLADHQRRVAAALPSAAALLDDAERHARDAHPDRIAVRGTADTPSLVMLRALRRIDQAVLDLARDLGAGEPQRETPEPGSRPASNDDNPVPCQEAEGH